MMSSETQPLIGAVELDDAVAEAELDLPWMENVVMAAGAAFTVLFVSSIAVLMYLA
jgi:Na+/phosphate symporter